MEEEGPADLEYGVMPHEYRSVEWRSRGVTDVYQGRSRSYRPIGGGEGGGGGGGTKLCQKGHPVKG